MGRKIIFFIICTFFLIPSTVLASPKINSPSAILINSKSGQVLYEKKVHDKHYPASITKVMTAILLLEEGNLEKVVTIGDDVPFLIERGSSQIYLIPGEQLTREQLLYALLVDSANDAAVAIAQDIAGSVEKFVQEMNEKAKELGTLNTNFVTPHGLHDDNHYTTAYDMALIACEAMKNPIFRQVVKTERYIIPATNKQDTRYLYLGNRLVRNTTYRNYKYDGANGVKTGYTSKAGNTLIASASRNDLDLITVVLNANGNEVYEDTISLLDYGFDTFQNKIAVKKGDTIEEIHLENADQPLPLIAKDTLEYCIDRNSNQEITWDIKLMDELSPPIEKGDSLGTMVFSLNGVEIDSIELIAGRAIESTNAFKNLNLPIQLKWIGIVIGLFLLYRTLVYIKKRRRIRARRLFNKTRKYI